MPVSSLPEAAAAGAAALLTAASVAFTQPPAASSATAADTAVRAAASAAAEAGDDESEAFTVDEAAFMEPTGPGLLRVCSFNIENLGQGTKRDFAKVAKVVRQFDLCGIVEIEEEQGLRDLVEALGPEWQSMVSAEVGAPGRPNTFESYGFVFRTSKVVIADHPVGFFPDPDQIFSREPFFASFRSGQFDFTMALLHAETAPAALAAELGALPAVFAHIQDLDSNEDDILIAGDFNRSPSTPTGKVSKGWEGFLGIPQMDCVIPDDLLTSLSSNPQGLANHFDEICLRRDLTHEVTTTVGVFNFVETMFGGMNKAADAAVSDHLPVWAEFRTDLPDDDGPPPATPGSSSSCCKICRTTKPCGNGCIQQAFNCTQPPGCACAE